MKKKLLLLVVFSHFFNFVFSQDWQKEENNERVIEAKNFADTTLVKLFSKENINFPPKEIFIRVFKEEKELELWVKKENSFVLLKTYTICRMSGDLGPKRKRGDYQVPEGFYFIELFNVNSWYFLSFKVSYPNFSDKILGAKDPGGDIYVHGSCVSVGCISIENEQIMELYWLLFQMRKAGTTFFPIHIFPFKFNNFPQNSWAEKQPNTKIHLFWKNILAGYSFFELNKKLPIILIDANGKYKW